MEKSGGGFMAIMCPKCKAGVQGMCLHEKIGAGIIVAVVLVLTAKALLA